VAEAGERLVVELKDKLDDFAVARCRPACEARRGRCAVGVTNLAISDRGGEGYEQRSEDKGWLGFRWLFRGR